MDLFGMEFENQESKDILKEIVDVVLNYDIYDFISRVSGLNLMSENQNKSVLLDFLIQYVIERDKSVYKSSTKMSSGKFRSVINSLNNTFLSGVISCNVRNIKDHCKPNGRGPQQSSCLYYT